MLNQLAYNTGCLAVVSSTWREALDRKRLRVFLWPMGSRCRCIHLADEMLDPGRLIQLARDIEPEYRGSYGDNSRGERRPAWSYVLTVGEVIFDAKLVKLARGDLFTAAVIAPQSRLCSWPLTT